MMWSGDDTNEYGEPVLLLLPSDDCRGVSDIIIKRRSHKINNSVASGASSSHAGGLPQYHDGDKLCPPFFLTCTTCNHGPMHLLLQLHAPLDDVDRTLYVFGCNNASCHSSASISRGEDDDTNTSPFRSCIGNGSLRCFRSQRRWPTTENLVPSPTSTSKNEKKNDVVEENDYWGADVDGGWGNEEGGNDDWGCGDNTTDLSMDDLESMMNDCEMRTPHSNKSSKPPLQPATKVESLPEKPAAIDAIVCDAPPSFEHYDLYMINEPLTRKRTGDGVDSDDDDDEEDDVDGSGNIDVSKVEQMLSRYLDVEEDEAILSALRGGSIASNNDNSLEGGGERYERLPPEERAFLSFTSRLKRAPGQVARYAYGGSPMWSVPPPTINNQKQQKKYLKSKCNKSQKNSTPLPAITNCECGAERVFEFQILPSLLHVLDVDGHATKNNGEDNVMDLIDKGGMNWGVIAVYSCSMSCDESREEFIIVQNAIDDKPILRKKMEKGDDSDDDD